MWIYSLELDDYYDKKSSLDAGQFEGIKGVSLKWAQFIPIFILTTSMSAASFYVWFKGDLFCIHLKKLPSLSRILDHIQGDADGSAAREEAIEPTRSRWNENRTNTLAGLRFMNAVIAQPRSTPATTSLVSVARAGMAFGCKGDNSVHPIDDTAADGTEVTEVVSAAPA